MVRKACVRKPPFSEYLHKGVLDKPTVLSIFARGGYWQEIDFLSISKGWALEKHRFLQYFQWHELEKQSFYADFEVVIWKNIEFHVILRHFWAVPNWLAGRSELAREVFRTGSRKHQSQAVPNWLAIFTF